MPTVSPAVLCWTRPSRPPTRPRLQACASATPLTTRPPCWSPPARTGTSKPGSWTHRPTQRVSSLAQFFLTVQSYNFDWAVWKCGNIYFKCVCGVPLQFILQERSILHKSIVTYWFVLSVVDLFNWSSFWKCFSNQTEVQWVLKHHSKWYRVCTKKVWKLHFNWNVFKVRNMNSNI